MGQGTNRAQPPSEATYESVRILFYEDSSDDAELMLRQLRRSGYRPVHRRVDTEADLRAALNADEWQVAIVDYMVPGFPGRAALKVMAQEVPDLPVIVASGHAPEEVVAATIRLGAVDYLLKDDIARVVPAVEHALGERRTRLERSEALVALHENEARYRALFDHAPVALCELDVTACRRRLVSLAEESGDLRSLLAADSELARNIAAEWLVVRVNDAAVRLFEAPDADYLMQGLKLPWAVAFPDTLVDLLVRLLELDPVKGLEIQTETISGTPLTVLAHVDRLEYGEPDDRIVALMSLTDVTEQRRAQDALAKRERMLSTLFANLPGSAYRCSYDPTFLAEFESEGVRELLGCSPEHLTDAGRHVFQDMMHPDNRQRVWEEVEAAVEQGQPFTLQYRMRTIDGTEKWVWDRGRAVRGPDGSVEALEGFIGDITELKLAEQELRVTRDRLQALLEATNAIIYTDTPTVPGVTTFITGNVNRLLGFPALWWLDDPAAFDNRIHPDDIELTLAAVRQTLASGEASMEYRFEHADGHYLWIHDEMRLVVDEAGQPQSIVGQLWDITERKLAEEAVRQSERLMTLRSRVADAFLTESGEDVFGSVLEIVQAEMRSPLGLFGYLDENGVLVSARMPSRAWQQENGAAGPLRFPRDTWGDALWASALETGEMLVVEAPSGVPAGHVAIERAMACPLVHAGAVIGLLLMANKEESYSDTDKLLLGDVAAYAAPILNEWLQRTRFEHALQKHQELLTLRNRIADIFLTHPDDGMYGEVLSTVLEALESSQGVFCYVEDNQVVAPSQTPQIWDNCTVSDNALRLDLDEDGMLARAIREQHTVVRNSPEEAEKGRARAHRVLATPVVHGDVSIGGFFVTNKDADYTDEDVALIEEIAAWVAPVLDARLHRQRAEEAERQARVGVELALTGGELGMYHWYVKDGRIEPDERCLEMLAYRRDEIRTRFKAFIALIHRDDRPATMAALSQVAEGKRDAMELEYRLRHADGSWRWMLNRGRIVQRDANGDPLRVSGTHLDITERKLAEQELAAGAERLRRTVHGAIAAMGSVVERRDPYTAGHERHVAELASLIGRELGLCDADLETLELAAQVHDIGKIGVPAEILARPGKLAEAEIDIVRLHPQIGHDILASVEFEGPVAEVVLQHHERLDGSGYPQGLAAERILPAACIIAVADVVEAMASHRPYRPALGMDRALEEIREQSGVLYDARAVAACERVIGRGDFSLS